MRKIMEFARWEMSHTAPLFNRFVAHLSTTRYGRPSISWRANPDPAGPGLGPGGPGGMPLGPISALDLFRKLLDSFGPAQIRLKPVDLGHYRGVAGRMDSMAPGDYDAADHICGYLADGGSVRLDLKSDDGETASSEVDHEDIYNALMADEKLTALFLQDDYDDYDVYAFALFLVERASKK